MFEKPSEAQIEYARKIAAALRIPLPQTRTKQSYWEFIRDNKEAAKLAPAAYVVNGAGASGVIILSFDRIPRNCADCRLYLDSPWYREDAFYGDGKNKCCPLGASTFNCLNSRPQDCPIRPVSMARKNG